MVAATSSRHFSWAFKLSIFIMSNYLDALDEILRGEYRCNNCY